MTEYRKINYREVLRGAEKIESLSDGWHCSHHFQAKRNRYVVMVGPYSTKTYNHINAKMTIWNIKTENALHDVLAQLFPYIDHDIIRHSIADTPYPITWVLREFDGQIAEQRNTKLHGRVASVLIIDDPIDDRDPIGDRLLSWWKKWARR